MTRICLQRAARTPGNSRFFLVEYGGPTGPADAVESCARAVRAMNGMTLHGQRICVVLAPPDPSAQRQQLSAALLKANAAVAAAAAAGE